MAHDAPTPTLEQVRPSAGRMQNVQYDILRSASSRTPSRRNAEVDRARPEGEIAPRPPMLAQLAHPSDGAPPPATGTRPLPTATDATSAVPLLVHEAELLVSTFHVVEHGERIVAALLQMGGLLSEHARAKIVFRIPATRLRDAMAAVDALGSVVDRNLRVTDVASEYRDLELRIHTLDTMRARLEELLRQATDVQSAIAVEQQLERTITELERMRAELRRLSEEIAYSTLTIHLHDRGTVANVGAPRLPFRWLRRLGLGHLYEL